MSDELIPPDNPAADAASPAVGSESAPTGIEAAAAKVRTFPQSPGVYLMKDAAGVVIYVGKAKNLRARAGSYFLKAAAEDRRTAELVKEIRDIDFLPAESEVDALLVEARLIKDMQPKYNQDLKDDKSFPYLEIYIREDFPRVEFTRQPHERGTKLYGPFASAGGLRGAIQVLQKIFKFRTCSLDIDDGDDRWRWFRPCLLASIHQCTAPCNLRVSKEEYRRDIHRLRMFLEGKKTVCSSRCAAKCAPRPRRCNSSGPPGCAMKSICWKRSINGAISMKTPSRKCFTSIPKKGWPGCRRFCILAQTPRTIEGRRYRASGRRTNGGQPRAIHRRPAVQAGLSAVQDPRRGGDRRFREHPRSGCPAVSAVGERRFSEAGYSAHRRRQGAASCGYGRIAAT